jgi:hypothetical protein
MATGRAAIALTGLALTASAMIIAQGRAQDVLCHKDDLTRQVQVQFAQDADGLPCRVVWQGSAASDHKQLVWRSNAQLDFCTKKARELVHQLIEGGWTCDAWTTAAKGRAAAPATIRLEPGADDADAALHPEPGAAEQAAPAPNRAREAAEPSDPAVLEAALERDVERLDQLARTSRGGFEVTAVRLGDLNGDGSADAVALLTHRPDGAPPSHHLLAYVFDGQTFRPVARFSLAETHAGFTNAELRDIVGGVIELEIQVPRDGDPPCCPSGHRRATFVLRDQHLVQAGKKQPDA